MKKLQRKQGAIIVGIWGVHSGAGVTTLAVALANYMQGFLNRRTALYEFNSKADFAKIYESTYGERCKVCDALDGVFSLKKVKYYLKGSTDMARISDGDYDIVIVDFGSNPSVMSEFMRCHHKIVVSSLEAWYCRKYEEFCERLNEYRGSNVWLHVLATDAREIKRIRRAYRVTATKRPYIDNAYVIDKNLIQFFSYFFE